MSNEIDYVCTRRWTMLRSYIALRSRRRVASLFWIARGWECRSLMKVMTMRCVAGGVQERAAQDRTPVGRWRRAKPDRGVRDCLAQAALTCHQAQGFQFDTLILLLLPRGQRSVEGEVSAGRPPSARQGVVDLGSSGLHKAPPEPRHR